MIDISSNMLPSGWEIVDEATAVACVKELSRELSSGHELFGLKVSALARYIDNILFSVDGGRKPFAMVHMTHRAADKPPWPDTFWYDSIQEWSLHAEGYQ